MAHTLTVDVVSPEAMLYSGEAEMVITRTLDGEVAFQAGHAAFLGALVENHTRIFQTDGTIQDIAVLRGFVEVSGTPTKVSILSDRAELAGDIDVKQTQADLERHLHTIRDEQIEEVVAEAISGRDWARAKLAAAGFGFTA